jgi:hypothetical protein
MTEHSLQGGFWRPIASLIIGSLAAPLIYVAIGFLAPSGFHDLRAGDLLVVAAAFGFAWLFSLLVTSAIGGLLWIPLHAYGYDRAIVYVVIALLAYGLLMVVSRADGWSWLGASMSAANALVVRIAERVHRWRGDRTQS